MTWEAFERGDWQALVAEHRPESTDGVEWLRLAAALLHDLVPEVEQQGTGAWQALEQALQLGVSADQARGAPRQVAAASLVAAMGHLAIPHAPLDVPLVVGPPVTLTAISERLATLPAVLASLKRQTYRPAQVHLHLSDSPHLLDGGVQRDDARVLQLAADPWVQVHWVPNLGPYRKIVPFLQAKGYHQGGGEQPATDLFITVDDDTLYPPRFVEYLVRNHQRHGCVVAHRGRRIRLASDGEPGRSFLPYRQWHDGLREPRLANLATGQSGVLYQRSWFPEDLELEAALAVAPSHDDLWLRWLTARQGVPAVILQPNAAANTEELAFPAANSEPLAQEHTLWHRYNGPCGGNDLAAAAVQAYWQARGFDLAGLLAEEQEQLADFY